MKPFPKTAEEFYALRDDRTNRCEPNARYQSASCKVILSASSAHNPHAQMAFLAITNLLSCWCRRVSIVTPSVQLHASLGEGELSELALTQMKDADPFGDFHAGSADDGCATVAVFVGNETGSMDSGRSTVFVNASGWLASISKIKPIMLPPRDSPNFFGAIAAACLSVAQAFKIVTEIAADNHIREGIFDTFTLQWVETPHQSPWPGTFDIGNMLMVGAGSVGSAAIYCMRWNGLSGRITVLDKDVVKVENFNRSPIFGFRSYGSNKADAVTEFLKGSALAATAEPLWWDEFAQKRERKAFDYDVWLPLANEHDVRRTMQHAVPPLMIHASTTANWGVNHGRHIPQRDDCLVDRFPKEVQTQDLACSTGLIPIPSGSVDAALPFASLFAGLLIACDLVKAQLPTYPQVPNFCLFDWYGPLDLIQSWDRKPRDGCICRDQGEDFHRLFNNKTKYKHLFTD